MSRAEYEAAQAWPCPGRITLDLALDLPHPRHYSVKTTPGFAALKAELTESVREEVRRAQGER